MFVVVVTTMMFWGATVVFAGDTMVFTGGTVLSVAAAVMIVAANTNPAFLGVWWWLCMRENAIFARRKTQVSAVKPQIFALPPEAGDFPLVVL